MIKGDKVCRCFNCTWVGIMANYFKKIVNAQVLSYVG